MNSPIRYHGGKSYLTKWIIGHFPPHRHYVEPYFGGGSVLFAKPPELVEGHSEVVNDIDQDLITFWKVLQDPRLFDHFYRLLECTPVSEQAFCEAVNSDERRLVYRAANFFTRARQSRQGMMKSFATLSKTRTRRGMNEQCSAWLTAVAGLPQVHQRLKRVVVLGSDAIEVIKREDTPHTFFYLDPPYMKETRVAGGYTYEMTTEDHAKLLQTLTRLKGKFLLSGYDTHLYRTYACEHGWRVSTKVIDAKSSSQKTKPTRTECLWANYPQEEIAG